MIDFADAGHTLVTGTPLSEIAITTATVGKVFGIAQIASSPSAEVLSDEIAYPYFNRLGPPPYDYPASVKAALLYYQRISGAGWTDVAVISAISGIQTSLATVFIEIAEPEITILTFQQYLVDAFPDGLDVEFAELQRSGARVFYAMIFLDWAAWMTNADTYGLVGESYVWIAPPAMVGYPSEEPCALCQGSIGAVLATRDEDDPIFSDFMEIWRSLDPEVYKGAGPDNLYGGVYVSVAFDAAITAAKAIGVLERTGELDGYVSPDRWNEVTRAIEFEGLSDSVAFYPNGDRIGTFVIQYYSTEVNNWITTGSWTVREGYKSIEDVVWFSNTTEIPDLDIREPFYYWSCDDGELNFDSTGKKVTRHTPDGSNVDEIDSDYHCDAFIDCRNLSDETNDCANNYFVVFLVFGIITGFLILISLILIVYVLVFGLVLGYKRVKRRSPIFLLILLISIIIGYCSVYAWFGKPHPVACGFQPWLLGLSAISMIAALSVKNFRIWRIFRFPLHVQKISNLELFVLWSGVMIPSVLILSVWTIVSTPTATMEERGGNDHYVCTTGGFTGTPGGMVFFFILVAYGAFVLFLGAIVSILIRNAPSAFNETKLLAISIYNLGFLSAVIIPVYLVVNPLNPFIAWILRTSAILYAFTATLCIQFIPMIYGFVVTDKCKNNLKVNLQSSSSSKNTSSTPFSQ